MLIETRWLGQGYLESEQRKRARQEPWRNISVGAGGEGALRRLRSGELGQPLTENGSKPVAGSEPGRNDQLDRFKVAFVLAYSLMCKQTLNE